MAARLTRLRVIGLYKDLQRLGRDYPDPSYDYNGRMRRLFEKNRHLKTEDEINQAIRLGEFIKQETLALYTLRKYRHLKRMYSDPPTPPPQAQQHPNT
ncbi:hypothetical protein BJ322DRAFT_1104193 [Thelephora terrestris]|uniref:Complex 1 LYR protein domain-containing protein n=1 Tax=Thelephora terrestris TaxID=56493 RepID=A0A9P6HQ70_9AGAM|nr:hypothetical protein BJ322DRAFT_1104193 [Thelephora terrestris]